MLSATDGDYKTTTESPAATEAVRLRDGSWPSTAVSWASGKDAEERSLAFCAVKNQGDTMLVSWPWR